MAAPRKPRLGRGLDGLLPSAPPKDAPAPRGTLSAPIEELHPNRDQPRRSFDDARLDELAQSIRALGVLEPVLVRKRSRGGYTIVAGERRWRAAQRAGLKELPIFVRELSEETAFEAALVENLQREDLNPIETARAFQRLVTEHGLSQDEVAKRVGKDRSTVANSLRLLKLPEELLSMIEAGELSEGHGRALLGAPNVSTMRALARAAHKSSMSVREVERRVRAAAQEGPDGAKPGADGGGKSANVRDLERRLSHALGTTVAIKDRKGKGQILVHYSSFDELDRILADLMR